MKTLKGIAHIHTKKSFDSLLSPSQVVDYAVKNGIDYIFITDHDTINGSLEARLYAKENRLPVNVVIGAEYSTDIGDIIGIFLKEEITEKQHQIVIKEIHRQKGLVILPHPYLNHDLNIINKLFCEIDFIETFNCRTSMKQDEQAMELMKKKGWKNFIGGDIHTNAELNNLLFEFNSVEDFINGNIIAIKRNKTYKYKIYYSQIIKSIRNNDLYLLAKSTIAMILFFFIRKTA